METVGRAYPYNLAKLWVATLRNDLGGVSDHAVGWGDPTEHGLVKNSQGKGVEPGVASHLTPAHRGFGVGQVAGQALDVKLAQTSDVAVGDQRTHEGFAGQAVGARNDHRREGWIFP